MKVEIIGKGENISPTEIIEFIRQNMVGKFYVEENKLYFDSEETPILPFKENRQAPANYRAPQSTKKSGNPFSRMGDELNKMCGL